MEVNEDTLWGKLSWFFGCDANQLTR